MNQAEMLMTLGGIRQIELQRMATGLLRDLLRQLEQLEYEASGLALEHPMPDSRRVASQRRAVRELLSEIAEMVGEVMAELRRRTEQFVDEVTEVTIEDERANFIAVFGLSLVGSPSVKAGTMLVGGATVQEHYRQMQESLMFRIRSEVQQSVMAGEAEELLYWRLRGKAIADGPPGEFLQTKRAVETLARTAVATIPNAVQLELAPRANVIGPTGWQHISVLDSRTTDTCRGRAWKKWDAEKKPVGHKLPFAQPPLHANCRSRLQLIFLDDPPVADISFKSWVESLTPKHRNLVFGKRNIEAWQAGRITDAMLVRQQNRPLSAVELMNRTKRKTDGQSSFPFIE